LTCFAISVQAATVDPVKFYLVDTDNDDRVRISNTFNWPFDLNLDWSYDGSAWSDWSPALMEFNKNAESYTGVVYLSIVVNGIRDISGDVTFDGGGINGNDDWYSSLLIKWSDSPHLSFLTLKPDDAVSPIPIASSALLLGSGVFGLMMIVTRKKVNEI
ncbi:MAG: hypothetical protein C0403_19980, partial [Desulfobacterium sp.]|nr:hypothetical protein [Desulfobacterium sp.]